MARQPTQDLQGLDSVATPSANMVDAYAGAPAMPRESSAGQLADALGTLSRAGQKSAAKAKAEQEELDKKRAESYAARFKGEEGEFLDSVKLGETYAHLSDTVVATIVEDKHRLDFYSKTKASLNNLDNDIRYDVVALEKHFDALLADATEKTAGMDFVQSGAVQGVQSAIREMRGQFSAQQNAFTKEQSKSNTEAAIYNILDKYDVTTPDGQVSAIALMNDLNEHTLATSPYKKGEDKQIMVDALIAYNKSNPESGAVNLIQRMPFLQGGQTKQKLNDAGPQIAKLSMAATQRRLFQESVKRDELLAEKQGVLNQLAEENDIEKIQQVQAEYAGAGDTPAERATANAIYEMAEIAEKSAQVDPDISSTNYTLAKEDLTVRASLGTAGSSKEEIAAINARTDISPQQKSALIQEVPTLIQGHKIIASEQHSTTFRQRFGSVVDTYKTNPMLAAKAFELSQRGLSAETIAKDTWDSETGRRINLHIEKNKEIPGYNDLYGDDGIYDKAGEAVKAKLQEVATLQAQFIQLDSQQPQLQPGDTIKDANGNPIATYNGGDINDDSNFTPITPEVDDTPEVEETPVVEDDPRYKVTKDTEYITNFADEGMEANRAAKQAKREDKATKAGFDKESATITLDDSVAAQLEKLVEGRYKRASKRKHEVSEDAIMDIVLDQLGLDGDSDFEYGGFFGDSPDTAGEIAIKKIVDSLMEKHKGE